jgi:hypothetical protein
MLDHQEARGAARGAGVGMRRARPLPAGDRPPGGDDRRPMPRAWSRFAKRGMCRPTPSARRVDDCAGGGGGWPARLLVGVGVVGWNVRRAEATEALLATATASVRSLSPLPTATGCGRLGVALSRKTGCRMTPAGVRPGAGLAPPRPASGRNRGAVRGGEGGDGAGGGGGPPRGTRAHTSRRAAARGAQPPHERPSGNSWLEGGSSRTGRSPGGGRSRRTGRSGLSWLSGSSPSLGPAGERSESRRRIAEPDLPGTGWRTLRESARPNRLREAEDAPWAERAPGRSRGDPLGRLRLVVGTPKWEPHP